MPDSDQTIPEPEKRLQKLLAAISELNHEVTPQGLAVLRLLSGRSGQPSPESIQQALKDEFPEISLEYVGATLRLARGIDCMLDLGFSDWACRYEENRPYPQPRVICSKCGAVVSAEFSGLEEAASQLAVQSGYRLKAHRLEFFGLCPKCQQES